MGRANAGIHFRRQPTNTTCGQTCIAMLADCAVADACRAMGRHWHKTTTKQVVTALRALGIGCPDKRVIHRKGPKLLPRNQPLLVNVSQNNWKGNCVWRHWMIYHAGQFYDPGWGVWRSYPMGWLDEGKKIRSYLPLDVPRLRRYYV